MTELWVGNSGLRRLHWRYACAIVDSVMDIDYAAGRITYDSADRIIEYIKEKA
jgi:hypothetical protein